MLAAARAVPVVEVVDALGRQLVAIGYFLYSPGGLLTGKITQELLELIDLALVHAGNPEDDGDIGIMRLAAGVFPSL